MTRKEKKKQEFLKLGTKTSRIKKLNYLDYYWLSKKETNERQTNASFKTIRPEIFKNAEWINEEILLNV